MVETRIPRVLWAISVLIIVLFMSLSAYAKYSGGTGESNDPYQIATAEDLMTLGENSDDYDKYFILTSDIDLDPNLPGRKVFGKAVVAMNLSDKSMFAGSSFNGVFDGNDHTIRHLTIKGTSCLGLFGYLGSKAIISNLGLESVDVNGTGDIVGGLVGINGGVVINCSITGIVRGNDCVGGLVSINDANINASHSNGTVSGNDNVGGLVGENSNNGKILTSYTTGIVSGRDDIGGLAGSNDHGNIEISYSTSAVTSIAQYSLYFGTPAGSAGGLVGKNNRGSIKVSYSSGAVSGNGEIGGLVGINDYGNIISSFWDMETSGQAISSGGIGLTTTEMQDVNTYLNARWDFVDEKLNGTCDYWKISPGDYPRLNYPAMPEGHGTTEQPYLIRDMRDLGTVWFNPMAHYRLESSVDLSNITWSMALIPWFEGTFDGNDNVISNLHIQGDEYLGLFGNLYSAAIISNLGLEVVDVNGTGNYVGGLVGYNFGSIVASYSTGTVRGYRYVGGLMGRNSGSIVTSYSTGTIMGYRYIGGIVGTNFNGSIASSYSSGSVTGDQNVGGLVGINDDGSISTSYSNATVTASEDVGGLTGLNIGSITTSYSTGSVTGDEEFGGLVGRDWYTFWTPVSGEEIFLGITTKSFWDTETSGQLDSAGGTGLTTTEMQTASTFLDAGWDFVEETENGMEDIWWILEGQDYPRLWWEAAEE